MLIVNQSFGKNSTNYLVHYQIDPITSIKSPHRGLGVCIEAFWCWHWESLSFCGNLAQTSSSWMREKKAINLRNLKPLPIPLPERTSIPSERLYQTGAIFVRAGQTDRDWGCLGPFCPVHQDHSNEARSIQRTIR